jgi:zinc protease
MKRWAAIAALACALATAARADQLRIPFSRYRLPNGLTVILAEDHRLPLVAVNVWYAASPAVEPPGRSGLAHLFEHMMYQGSQHVGTDQHIRLLEENGATLWNGTTDYDRTNYFETLPASRLELALWLEADRMGFFEPALDQAKLDAEREVVRNERRETVDDTPYAASEEALVQALYPPGHPYHGFVIGSIEELDAATLEEVARFHRQHYAPGAALLTIAGDFVPARAKALVEKYFGALPARAAPPPRTVPLPRPGARRIERAERVALPRVWAGWVTAPIFSDGDAELDLAARLLGDGRASRLWRRLVTERELASEVRCQREPLAHGSLFECWATAAEGVAAPKLERALSDEIEALRASPVPPAELERARRGLTARKLRALDQLGGFGGKSDALAFYQHYRGDPGGLAADLDRYRAVTAASLRAAAQANLDPGHRVLLITLPQGKR